MSEPRQWVAKRMVMTELLRDVVSPMSYLMADMQERANQVFAPRRCRLVEVASVPVHVDGGRPLDVAIFGGLPNGYLYRFTFEALDDTPQTLLDNE